MDIVDDSVSAAADGDGVHPGLAVVASSSDELDAVHSKSKAVSNEKFNRDDFQIMDTYVQFPQISEVPHHLHSINNDHKEKLKASTLRHGCDFTLGVLMVPIKTGPTAIAA